MLAREYGKFSLKEKMDHIITIYNLDKKIVAKNGDLLADKIQESGIDLSLYCQKRGMCGKCFVEILNGSLPPLDNQEDFLIRKQGLAPNHRLACRYKITGDLAINIPEASLLRKTEILKTGIKLSLAIDPPAKKYFVELDKPKLGHPHSLLGELERHFRKKHLDVPLNTLRSLPVTLEKSQYDVTVVMYGEKEVLAVESGDTRDRSFGLAVDLGTTTLVVELVDLETGNTLDIETGNNRQMKFGMDIVSRISFAYDSPENLEKLQAAVIEALSPMIKRLLDRNRISSVHVYDIVFAGNTAMNHMLLGVPVDTLAVSPFHAVFHRVPSIEAHQLGLRVNPNARVYVAPNIKSFVGGDISAGLLATDLPSRKGSHLFIDLGTNGEIVLKTEKKFVATSTAAGPAFEGMNISSGMLALPGAIYKAEKNTRLVLHTIGKTKPQGICGTGLIDLIAIYLDEGRITQTGKIADGSGKIDIVPGISLTQKDIREIQLALAAIKSGIRMICEKFRLKKEDLDNVFIAGAFGNYLNTENAMRIGLLPWINSQKIVFVGNSSLAGARAMLLSASVRKGAESLLNKIQYTSLATDRRFQEYFIDSLNFASGTES